MAMTPMQIDPQSATDPRVAEVIQQARNLLSQLNAARQSSEVRQCETGRIDPMKSVTGRSSLDIAIDRTESLIDEMQMLTSINPGVRDHVSIETDSSAFSIVLRRERSSRNARDARLPASSTLALVR